MFVCAWELLHEIIGPIYRPAGTATRSRQQLQKDFNTMHRLKDTTCDDSSGGEIETSQSSIHRSPNPMVYTLIKYDSTSSLQAFFLADERADPDTLQHNMFQGGIAVCPLVWLHWWLLAVALARRNCVRN